MRVSLNSELDSVEWGDFKLGDLFNVQSSLKRFDANKVTITDSGYPYVVRTSVNNGHRGMIEENPQFLNPGNTISFGQDTATIFYQESPYFTGDKIKILVPKDVRFRRQNAQFIIAAMNKSFNSFSWGASRFNVNTLTNQSIRLPKNADGVDYEWIERFVAELEAYLKVTDLNDTSLTAEEGEDNSTPGRG
ncbi:restriction endonuclease subunit S [Corynebacterium kroppenstedtii]|jgi:type IIS restriction enzyme R protein|uniref:restriction endonuclease subunit S n=1 Tax=Corynebacterium kroppenstedtii TaxID=161879 RepID=UPI0026F33746|nr:restriction endonuclease subunit S [Corynebacterium kroppenstedtii]MDU7286677.1 restriction endonuclease subunit S [Corynebacterium kroppenstedtii]